MADVHVHRDPGGGAGWVVAIVAIAVIALLAWFLLAGGLGGGAATDTRDVNVEISVPEGVGGGGQSAPGGQ